jgi:hypothetical protein
MKSLTISIAICSLIVGVLLLSGPPSTLAQSKAKCQYCGYVACEGSLSGVCNNGSVKATCTLSGSSCPYECSETIGCGRTGAADPTDPNSANVACTKKLTAKLVKQYLKNEADRRADEDAEVRDQMLKNGGSGVRIEAQYSAPATLSYAAHGSHDLLVAGQILNLSEKSIVAVRVGWLVKSPNEPYDLKVGEWNILQSPVEPEGVGDIGAQKIDTAPMFIPGTVARLYLAEIKFDDGSIWKRPEEKKAPTNDSTSAQQSTKVAGSR